MARINWRAEFEEATRQVTGHIYFLLREDGLVRIGHAAPGQLRWRMQRHRISIGFEMIGLCKGTREREADLQRKFARYRVVQKIGPRPELFDMPPDVIEKIRKRYGNLAERYIENLNVDRSFAVRSMVGRRHADLAWP